MDFLADDARMGAAREHMVETQIEARGISDARVLEAMRTIPRHRFVPSELRIHAHEDHPLPLGHGQTISQPYIVAYMAEELGLLGCERVLEVGSGSGYMAAVLSLLVEAVYGIELEASLYAHSQVLLQELGYGNIHLMCGDGAMGWEEQAPFNAILLSCAANAIPPALWDQLAPNGRMILPLGTPYGYQQLVRITRTPEGQRVQPLLAVSFVPLR